MGWAGWWEGDGAQAGASFLLARQLRLFFSHRRLLPNFPSSWINKQQVPTSTKQELELPHKSGFQQRQAPPGVLAAGWPQWSQQGWGWTQTVDPKRWGALWPHIHRHYVLSQQLPPESLL